MKLSVAMGTYNGDAYLRAQLASITAQTRPPDEIVVCDDCSTDETRALLEAFALATPIPVRLHVNERNLGSTRSFERAIGLCTGDIIALGDQDDVWRDDKLRRIEESFTKAPAAGLFFSDAEIVDEDLNPLGQRMWSQLGFDRKQRRLMNTGRALDVLVAGGTVTGATMAFRSQYRSLVLPIPAGVALIHDGWIALTISSVAEVVWLDEPLIKYRQHAKQQVGAPANRTQERSGPFQAIEAGLRRSTSYSDLQTILRTLQERLNSQAGSLDCRHALANIKNYLDHIQARAGLAPQRLSRMPAIIRELMKLRYHRYSEGFFSAVKDLVA